MTDEGLYEPKNDKDLREQYPELYSVPQFQTLRKHDLTLSWHYACPTSPIAMLDHDQAVENSFRKVYGENVPYEEMERWKDKTFPQGVKEAIDKWKSMKPQVRSRAKGMVEKMLKNLESMVEVSDKDFQKTDEEGNVIKGVDWQARNQYANFCRITCDILPALIQQAEQGFGITQSGKGGELGIDRFHQRKKG